MGKGVRFFNSKRHAARASDIAEAVTLALRSTEAALPCPTLPFVLVVTTHPGTCKGGKPRVLRGDHDNYAKLVADACEGILYANDKQGKIIVGIEGRPVEGMGLQVLNILWFDEGEDYHPALEDSLLALLTALELRDR